MKAAILDRNTLGDLDISPLENLLPGIAVYDHTSKESLIQRCGDLDIILTNKCLLSKEVLDKLPRLKFIQILATGTNNVDIDHASRKNIIVKNISGYSTESVSTHVMSMLLNLSTSIPSYLTDVGNGLWQKAEEFTFLTHDIDTLHGKTLGIVGYGNIGRRVKSLAEAFGMDVLLAKGVKDTYEEERLPLKTVLEKVDFLLLSLPLTTYSKNLITIKELQMMKPSACLINAARGGIVNEKDLAEALAKGLIKGAAVDVLTQEPPEDDNPLLSLNHEKLYMTPHIAWAAKSAREILLEKVLFNLKKFLKVPI